MDGYDISLKHSIFIIYFLTSKYFRPRTIIIHTANNYIYLLSQFLSSLCLNHLNTPLKSSHSNYTLRLSSNNTKISPRLGRIIHPPKTDLLSFPLPTMQIWNANPSLTFHNSYIPAPTCPSAKSPSPRLKSVHWTNNHVRICTGYRMMVCKIRATLFWGSEKMLDMMISSLCMIGDPE